MLNSGDKHRLPAMTLALIVGTALLVGGIFFGLIFPVIYKINTLKADTFSKQIQLEEQKRYFPLFEAARKTAAMEFSPKLPQADRKPIARARISSLSRTFSNLASQTGLVLSGNTLDIGGTAGHSKSITVELSLTGSLFDFRQYLISLAGLTAFEGIETLTINTDKKAIKKFITRIRIQVEPQ